MAIQNLCVDEDYERVARKMAVMPEWVWPELNGRMLCYLTPAEWSRMEAALDESLSSVCLEALLDESAAQAPIVEALLKGTP